MNRVSCLSKHLTSSPPLNEIYPDPVISYTKSEQEKTLMHLIKYSPFFMTIPFWVLSPFYFLAKMLTSSFETRLNLLLVLLYQYVFHRKSKNIRKMLGQIECYRFFDGYQLIIEDQSDLKPEKSLFPFHPHGMVCYGLNFTAMNYPFFQNAEIVGSRMSFQIPWGGLVMKLFAIEGANPENFSKLMSENKNLMFVPGGFEEATITQYGKDRVFIKHRKGFIKMALEFGYTVHPCYIFGENKLYYTYTNETFGLLMNKLKMPGVMAYTRNGLLPNDDVKLYTVIGKGIKIPIVPNPTQEMVDKYHNIYIEKLVELYDKWKGRCGGQDKLEVL